MVHVLSFEGAYSMLAAGDISSVYETKQVCSRALRFGRAVEGMQSKQEHKLLKHFHQQSLTASRATKGCFLLNSDKLKKIEQAT